MKFKLSESLEKNKARQRFDFLLEKGANIELKEIRKPRSLNHNAYLHVCISLFAIEEGYSLKEAKKVLKKECHGMIYEKKGHLFLKSTAKMDSKELTIFVEWIRNFCAKELGLYIPDPDEYLANKFAIDAEIEMNKTHL
jgi:hypothetical protein